MNIGLVGLNYKTAPIAVREKLSFSNGTVARALSFLKKNPRVQESLILSTCNRVEVYVAGQSQQDLNCAVEKFLSDFHRLKTNQFKKHLYTLNNFSAIRHLFRVSSSLDSQVLGENQILGQIKSAYNIACNARTIDRSFSFLFEEAIKIGKRTRTQTQIGRGAVSISTAAVEMAKKIFEDIEGKKILIMGAGKIGELSAKHFYSRGGAVVLVANRTFSKAQQIAEKFKGMAIPFSQLEEALLAADIVISSVSAPHLIVKKPQVQQIMKRRRQRSIFFIDLGLPRNIDPSANEIDNVYVYNLDDLEKVKDSNLQERLNEADKVEKLIEEHMLKIKEKINLETE